MTIVISQPMYFPWIGMFEQINLSDLFVFYDDVQYSKGSFTNRVQIKTLTGSGFKWLSVPLKGLKLGQHINEVEIDNNKNWRNQHYELLRQSYMNAPYYREMLDIVENLFSENLVTISEFSRRSMELIVSYFGMQENREFYISSVLNISGNGSQRVFDIVRFLRGDRYITGHGARNYLDHELFERDGIEVEYMDYRKIEYPQLYGSFNPHVSILDLIANQGLGGKIYICSKTKKWREFMYES